MWRFGTAGVRCWSRVGGLAATMQTVKVGAKLGSAKVEAPTWAAAIRSTCWPVAVLSQVGGNVGKHSSNPAARIAGNKNRSERNRSAPAQSFQGELFPIRFKASAAAHASDSDILLLSFGRHQPRKLSSVQRLLAKHRTAIIGRLFR